MKAENFISYLEDASFLQKISYQELKSMVVQYPYCQNLRYLLVTKSHLDDMSEYQSDLQLAATYSIDRNFLYKHLHQEAYIQSTTETLDLNVNPTEDQPMEAIPVEVVEPVKEVLDFANVTERRTIRIQSENAKLYAEQKAGLADESAPTANFIDIEEEIENKPESTPSDEVLETSSVEDISGSDISDTHDESMLEDNADSDSLINEIIQEDAASNESDEEEAEPITDRSKLITYIEKPEHQKSRSVIDQLMKRNVVSQDDAIEELFDEDIDIEDELESIPNSGDEKGEKPPSIEEPEFKEVVFEITNELNAEFEASNENNDSDESFEEANVDNDGDEAPQENDDEQEDARPDPIPKTSFKDWKEQFLPDTIEEPAPEISIEEILREEDDNVLETVIEEEVAEEKKKKKKRKDKNKMKKKKEEKTKSSKKKKKKKKRKMIEIAKKSIRENDDIISETLAELLAKQGSRKKAIQMYKRLSLIFPEKNSFFAEKIEKLKK